MSIPIILASGSAIRAQLLRNAGVPFTVSRPAVDEGALKSALLARAAAPREIALALADAKARDVGGRNPEAMVIGCDQILEFAGRLVSKAESVSAAEDLLRQMRGQSHCLLSAAVIRHRGDTIWRHAGQVRLQMREMSDAYIGDYVRRNWPGIGDAVGCYKLEEEGVRLFTAIEGDYFHVLGMPLIELLSFLMIRGVIET